MLRSRLSFLARKSIQHSKIALKPFLVPQARFIKTDAKVKEFQFEQPKKA